MWKEYILCSLSELVIPALSLRCVALRPLRCVACVACAALRMLLVMYCRRDLFGQPSILSLSNRGSADNSHRGVIGDQTR